MKYPIAPMMRKPMPTAWEILRNSRLSAVRGLSAWGLDEYVVVKMGRCAGLRRSLSVAGGEHLRGAGRGPLAQVDGSEEVSTRVLAL